MYALEGYIIYGYYKRGTYDDIITSISVLLKNRRRKSWNRWRMLKVYFTYVAYIELHSYSVDVDNTASQETRIMCL